MASFLADEDFPVNASKHLRSMGHDVLTLQETGLANRGTADEEVLLFAVSQQRILLTMNRRHFIRLHRTSSNHFGIIACTADPDTAALALRINLAVTKESPLARKLVRVNRPG